MQSWPKPRNSDQDGLNACISLLVGLYQAEGKELPEVGDRETLQAT
jgi:hypothetical protein